MYRNIVYWKKKGSTKLKWTPALDLNLITQKMVNLTTPRVNLSTPRVISSTPETFDTTNTLETFEAEFFPSPRRLSICTASSQGSTICESPEVFDLNDSSDEEDSDD